MISNWTLNWFPNGKQLYMSRTPGFPSLYVDDQKLPSFTQTNHQLKWEQTNDKAARMSVEGKPSKEGKTPGWINRLHGRSTGTQTIGTGITKKNIRIPDSDFLSEKHAFIDPATKW